jgi:Tfp pilus assembly protein PilN
MPAKDVSINLIGNQDLEHTPWGRIVLWATTYGRYIMITTEIIVLLAFISRFSLDRKLTDLNEEIGQKQTIIEANSTFEKEVKSLQVNINSTQKVMNTQDLPVNLAILFESLLPPDVYLTSADLSLGGVSVDVIAGSIGGFSQFIANLESSKFLKNVTLGDVTRNPTSGIQFHLSAAVVGAPKLD